jgi:hypothetical protein
VQKQSDRSVDPMRRMGFRCDGLFSKTRRVARRMRRVGRPMRRVGRPMRRLGRPMRRIGRPMRRIGRPTRRTKAKRHSPPVVGEQ